MQKQAWDWCRSHSEKGKNRNKKQKKWIQKYAWGISAKGKKHGKSYQKARKMAL